MIGVLSNVSQCSVVREFFELFKTSWEFYREGVDYDVLLSTCGEIPESPASLVILWAKEECAFDREHDISVVYKSCSSIVRAAKVRLPIYGACAFFESSHAQLMVNEVDGRAAALCIRENGQTVVRLGFDFFEEVRLLLEHGQPTAHASVPALEMHISFIRKLLTDCAVSFAEIPPVPRGFKFIACLTHDVDHAAIRNHRCDATALGFLYRATMGSLFEMWQGKKSVRQFVANCAAALSIPFVHLGLAKDFWRQFGRYVELERGQPSTFFVIPRKGHPGKNTEGIANPRRAARYELDDISTELRALQNAEKEIGLHGIDAWRNSGLAVAERELLKNVIRLEEIGVRMHWLYFDQTSPKALDEAGFSYDSTVGYNDAIGYRAGTTQAFRPLGVERLIELPMHIMDTALFFPDRMGLSPCKARAAIDKLIDNAVTFGGVLTINWHDRSIAPERQWDGFYVELLAELERRGAWFASAGQTVAWFRKRRAVHLEGAASQIEILRAKQSVEEQAINLPGLSLLFHQTHAQNDRAAACELAAAN